MLRLSLLLLTAVPAAAADVTATKLPERVEFKAGDKLITAYQYAGTVQLEKAAGTKPLAKPYLYPLAAPNGGSTTRGWPVARGTAGETTDHFHQKSVWFCHGDVIPEGVEMKTRSADKRVHGVDFWAESAGHGRIVCLSAGDPTHADGAAKVATKNEWRTPDDVPILAEARTLTVSAKPAGYLIEFDIVLTAAFCPVTFGDTKEGSMGVRVSDEFRLNRPGSDGVVASSDGATAKAPGKDNLPMWGKPADWHDYSGTSGGKAVGLAVFDHPSNPHRALWHTRAYGLMAANPFGRGDSGFPAAKGKSDLVKLAKGESLKLRYAVYAHDGDATAGRVAEVFKAYAGR